MRRARATLAAVLLLLPCAVAAEEKAESPASAETAAAPAAPAPFPLAEVTVRADETREELKEMSRRLGRSTAVKEIEEQLPTAALLVRDAARETQQRMSATGIHLRAIEDMERAWIARRKQITAWRDQLTQRGAAVNRDAARIEELRGRWRATRESAVASNTSSALEWIDRALSELDDASREATERTRALVALQGRVAQVDEVIANTLDQARQLRELRRQHLLDPDSPPIWSISGAAGVEEVRSKLLDDWKEDWKTLVAFVSARTGRMVSQLLLALAVLLCVTALRRHVADRGPEAPALGEAARVFQQPLSVALLAWVLTARWFHPLAPAVFASAVTLVLLIPALRLLPGVVDRPLRPVIYVVAGFYLASEVREQLANAPGLSRLLLTLEILGALAVLVWMMRPARLARVERPAELPPFLRVVLRLLLGLAGAALVADVFGFVGFASVLTGGLLWSVWGALILHGSYRVVLVLLTVALDTSAARRLRAVRVASDRILDHTARILRLGGFLWWLALTLRAFAIDDAVYDGLAAGVTTSVEVGSVSLSLADVLMFVVVVAAAFLLSRFVRFVLQEDVFPRVALRRGVSNAIATTIHYSILFLGLLFALAAAGVDLSRVTLLAGAFGVGIGFGLQNVVNNFVSGLILLFERPIQVGDTIEVGGLLGDVRHIGPRSSTVRTFDGAEVIVPNGMLISDQVINWTLSDRRRRLTVPVGVAYGSDPEQVLDILRETARTNTTVLDDPEPLAIFVGFGDSSLDFELRCWIPRFEEGFVMQSALRVEIYARLQAAGVEIPFPQRDLHLRSVADAARGAGPPPKPPAGEREGSDA